MADNYASGAAEAPEDHSPRIGVADIQSTTTGEGGVMTERAQPFLGKLRGQEALRDLTADHPWTMAPKAPTQVAQIRRTLSEGWIFRAYVPIWRTGAWLLGAARLTYRSLTSASSTCRIPSRSDRALG